MPEDTQLKLPRVMVLVGKYSPEIGGAEIMAQRLAEGLVRRGMQVTVLTGLTARAPRREVMNGVAVRRIGYFHSLRIGKIKFFIQMAAMFVQLALRRKQYDVIHAHQAHWLAFVGAVAGRVFHKPCIVTLHSARERFDLLVLRNFLPFGGAMGRYIVRRAEAFIAISNAVAEELPPWGVAWQKIRVIPNGVPIPAATGPRDAAAREALEIPREAFLVVFVGALRGDKHPLLALEAFALLREKNRAARMIFLGDGPLRPALRARVDELALGAEVALPGNARNVPDYLRAADALVMPSDVEGFGLAIAEAMAHRLACVGTRAPGIVELIRDGETGLLIESHDKHALAAAFERLAGDAELRRRLGANARAMVAEKFDLEKIVDAHVELFREENSLL